MKAGWESTILGNVIDLQNGFAFKSAEFTEEGHFLMRIANVQNGHISLEKPKFVKLTEQTKRFELKKGDILTSLTGNVGRVAEIKASHLPAALNQRVARIKPKEDFDVDRSYLLHFLSSDAFSSFLEQEAHGAAQANVSPNAIKEVPFALPPLEEQKRIVSILDEAFEGLDRARENAEANLKSARELFESVLLSVFGKMSDKNDLFLLKEVSKDFARGKSKHRPRNDKSLYGGKYPFIQTGDVRNAGHRVTAFTATYNEKGLAQSKLWPSGTVCITIAANIAETSILSFDACFPDSVIGMVPDEAKTSSDYVEYVLQFFQKRLKAAGEGAAQENINLKTFESEYFPFPSLTKQSSAISKLNTASEIQQKIRENYTSKLQDISDLRQSLLQKAFAGELT